MRDEEISEFIARAKEEECDCRPKVEPKIQIPLSMYTELILKENELHMILRAVENCVNNEGGFYLSSTKFMDALRTIYPDWVEDLNNGSV